MSAGSKFASAIPPSTQVDKWYPFTGFAAAKSKLQLTVNQRSFDSSTSAGQQMDWRTLSNRQATGRHEHQATTMTANLPFLK